MNGVQRNVSKIYIVLFCRENLLFFCYKSCYNVLLKGRFAHWYFQILISLILQNTVSLESDAAIKKKNTTENKCVKQDFKFAGFQYDNNCVNTIYKGMPITARLYSWNKKR